MSRARSETTLKQAGDSRVANPGPRWKNGGTAFTKAEIAGLPMSAIQEMSCDELAGVIRAADVPLFRESTIGRLDHCDRATLEQLVYVARRTVRNRKV